MITFTVRRHRLVQREDLLRALFDPQVEGGDDLLALRSPRISGGA
jgi:hypothetical protein